VNNQVLGQKMHESWQGLFTNSIDHRLSFPSPTHMNIFSNHKSRYRRLNTATCRVQQIAIKQNLNDSDLVSDSSEIITFNLLLSFFDQVT
jgi:hypothetical protein